MSNILCRIKVLHPIDTGVKMATSNDKQEVLIMEHWDFEENARSYFHHLVLDRVIELGCVEDVTGGDNYDSTKIEIELKVNGIDLCLLMS